MKTEPKAKGGVPKPMPQASSSTRIIALVVAAADVEMSIAAHLRLRDVEVVATTSYSKMAEALLDERDHGRRDDRIIFVLDLRISCGASLIDARLADYDAVLNAHMLSGHPWPTTLCLVEPVQTHPNWLQSRPHLRATLLADEVETVIGFPQQHDWREKFASALNRCLQE